MKNSAVCAKKPNGVGVPSLADMLMVEPNRLCVNVYVTGLAIRKKIRVA